MNEDELSTALRVAATEAAAPTEGVSPGGDALPGNGPVDGSTAARRAVGRKVRRRRAQRAVLAAALVAPVVLGALSIAGSPDDQPIETVDDGETPATGAFPYLVPDAAPAGLVLASVGEVPRDLPPESLLEDEDLGTPGNELWTQGTVWIYADAADFSGRSVGVTLQENWDPDSWVGRDPCRAGEAPPFLGPEPPRPADVSTSTNGFLGFSDAMRPLSAERVLVVHSRDFHRPGVDPYGERKLTELACEIEVDDHGRPTNPSLDDGKLVRRVAGARESLTSTWFTPATFAGAGYLNWIGDERSGLGYVYLPADALSRVPTESPDDGVGPRSVEDTKGFTVSIARGDPEMIEVVRFRVGSLRTVDISGLPGLAGVAGNNQINVPSSFDSTTTVGPWDSDIYGGPVNPLNVVLWQPRPGVIAAVQSLGYSLEETIEFATSLREVDAREWRDFDQSALVVDPPWKEMLEADDGEPG